MAIAAIPEIGSQELEDLKQRYSDKGFIVTNVNNLINWGQNRLFALDDVWSCMLCCRNDANVHA